MHMSERLQSNLPSGCFTQVNINIPGVDGRTQERILKACLIKDSDKVEFPADRALCIRNVVWWLQ